MAAPWLSVIIPCHNGRRWLAATLQSIVDQQEEGLEVILIDSSPDKTCLAIVDSFCGMIKIHALRRPDLLPWTAKTNFGAELASGDRICMLHQDDLWLPNRSAELRQWISRQPDGVIHLHPCYIIDEAGRRLGLWRCPLPSGEFPVPAHLLYERLLVQNFIGIPAPVIRREAYLEVGGLDDALWYTADWDLYLKIASTGNVYYHSQPLACFRIHRNSLTVLGSRDSTDFRNQHQTVVERHSRKLSPQIKKKILRLSSVSTEINVALAEAMSGRFGNIPSALFSLCWLGPQGMHQYFLSSRIVERVVPRLRALASGSY